jgi:hypothetical protein
MGLCRKDKALRKLLSSFTKEVDEHPTVYGAATKEFIQAANEAMGTRPKPPLVGWIIPRDAVWDESHLRVAGIELNDELRKGIILTREEIMVHTVGAGLNAVAVARDIIRSAAEKMDKITR